MTAKRSPAARPADGPRCPTCEGPVPPAALHRPFCSPRCKMVDLGRWFHGDYVVPGESAVSFEDLEELGALLEREQAKQEERDERDA